RQHDTRTLRRDWFRPLAELPVVSRGEEPPRHLEIRSKFHGLPEIQDRLIDHRLNQTYRQQIKGVRRNSVGVGGRGVRQRFLRFPPAAEEVVREGLRHIELKERVLLGLEQRRVGPPENAPGPRVTRIQEIGEDSFPAAICAPLAEPLVKSLNGHYYFVEKLRKLVEWVAFPPHHGGHLMPV